ncbi:MAG TPA: hypothetical protein VKQ52_10440, partial [Puia sp.]|nr:hypothetical protein [Puia sp.]
LKGAKRLEEAAGGKKGGKKKAAAGEAPKGKKKADVEEAEALTIYLPDVIQGIRLELSKDNIPFK